MHPELTVFFEPFRKWYLILRFETGMSLTMINGKWYFGANSQVIYR